MSGARPGKHDSLLWSSRGKVLICGLPVSAETSHCYRDITGGNTLKTTGNLGSLVVK